MKPSLDLDHEKEPTSLVVIASVHPNTWWQANHGTAVMLWGIESSAARLDVRAASVHQSATAMAWYKERHEEIHTRRTQPGLASVRTRTLSWRERHLNAQSSWARDTFPTPCHHRNATAMKQTSSNMRVLKLLLGRLTQTKRMANAFARRVPSLVVKINSAKISMVPTSFPRG